MSRKTGTVKWFDNPKGFGFIVNDEGEDVFVHYRSITGEGFKTLKEGSQVSYIETQSDKGLQASEVELHPEDSNREDSNREDSNREDSNREDGNQEDGI